MPDQQIFDNRTKTEFRVGYADLGDATTALKVSVVNGGGTGETIGTPKSGTATTTPQTLAAGASASVETCRSVTIVNTHASTTIYWGDGTAQLMPLTAGASVSIPCTSTGQVFVKVVSSTATYAYIPVIAV